MLNENDAPCIKEQEPNATNVRNHTTNTTPKEFKNKGSPHDPNNHNRSTIRNQNKLKKHGIPYVKEQESTAIHVQNCTTNTMPKKFKDKDNPYDVNNNNPSTIHKQNKLEKNDITYVNAAHVQNRQPRQDHAQKIDIVYLKHNGWKDTMDKNIFWKIIFLLLIVVLAIEKCCVDFDQVFFY